MQKIKLRFVGIRPIGKQHGTKMRTIRKNGKVIPCGYLSPEYKQVTHAVGMIGKVQCNQKGWLVTDEPLEAVCAFVQPKKAKGRMYDIVDNALSSYFDALEGVVYKNDNQISRFIVERFTGGNDWVVEMEFRKRGIYDQQTENT